MKSGDNISRKNTFNVVVCGNYGATNLGDEAILDGILSIVNEAFIKSNSKKELLLTVLSANPESTAMSHKVNAEFLFPAGVRSFFRGIFGGTIGRTIDAIRGADLFILGGGGLFTDEKKMAIVIWSLQARIARMFGVPVFCMGQSVGPLKTSFGRDMTKNVYMNARGATVRDKKSVDLLAELGVKKVTELADPVFALGDEHLESRGTDSPEKLAVFSVRPWKNAEADTFYETLAAFIVWLWREHGVKSVLVPFQIIKDNDLECLNTILDRIERISSLKDGGKANQNKPEIKEKYANEFAEIYEYSSDYNKVIELMSRADFVCGMRLHSLIFSSLAGCPFIGISYSSKVRESAKKLGMEGFVIDLNTISLPLLTEKYEKISKERNEIRAKMKQKSIELRAKAKDHVKFLSDVMESLC